MFKSFAPFMPALALLGACVSVLPEPEAPRGLYALAPADPTVSLAANVVIREFEAPELMAGAAMVSEDEEGARRLVKSVEWSGRLTRELQMALVDSFDGEGAGTALLPELGVSAQYRVIGRVQSLLLRGQSAECVATVSVTDTIERNLAGQSSVRANSLAARDRAAERAQALQMTAELCVQRIAEETARIVETLEADS